jgi:hypothetical protein
LQGYRPARVRSILSPRLDALKADGYLLDYRWRKEGKGAAPVILEVAYVPDAPAAAVPLGAEEAEAIDLIGRVLGEPENRTYHTHVVRELGHKQARALLSDVEASNARNRAALFAHLVKNAKRR